VKPSISAHILVVLLLMSSVVGVLLMLVAALRGSSSFEESWDKLALWVDEVLK
jgi:hypothetical protein